MFITFEGIEGCGKTTQSRKLYNRIKERGIDVTLSREPGGCTLGERVREIVLSTTIGKITSRTELFLYLAARCQHVEEVILPALKEGKMVIVDRFNDSTIAYQGYGRGFNRDLVIRLCDFACRGRWPDLTFVLDLPVEEGLRRAQERNRAQGLCEKEGRFEEECMEFHQRIRLGYLDMARKNPHRIVVIDARGSMEEVGDTIWEEVKKKIGSGYNQ